ncbi:MAG: Uma2 family endonuclease [Planctomycetaceae bacterium]|nr:Uma2 family endonuclease [Planctomycetaceae bacterium]
MSIAELPVAPPDEQTPLCLHAGSNGILMSVEEFESLTEEDCDPRFRYELINGVVVVNPPPGDFEIDANDELGRLLRNYQATPQGKVLDKTLFERDVRTKVGIRRVDRALWIGFGRSIRSKRDRATILVEFVSPGKRAALRDYQEKRDEYLEMGAKEYWVIDRFRRTMTVYFQKPANPAERVVMESETYTTPLLPGFELPLKRIVELASQYAEDESDV